jgi:hypothetical protein
VHKECVQASAPLSKCLFMFLERLVRPNHEQNQHHSHRISKRKKTEAKSSRSPQNFARATRHNKPTDRLKRSMPCGGEKGDHCPSICEQLILVTPDGWPNFSLPWELLHTLACHRFFFRPLCSSLYWDVNQDYQLPAPHSLGRPLLGLPVTRSSFIGSPFIGPTSYPFLCF